MPRIKSVDPLGEKRLLVTFVNGIQKIYSCQEIIPLEQFRLLASDALFKSVVVDVGGYGVSWDDEMDLSEYELRTNGVEIAPSKTRLIDSSMNEQGAVIAK